MRTRSRASTSNTAGCHLQPLLHTPTHSMDTRSRASISNTPSDHVEPLRFTRQHSLDIRSHASISNTPGGRLQPLRYTHAYPTHTLSRASTSNTPVGHFQPLLNDTCATPWAPVLVQVFQTLQVTTSSRCFHTPVSSDSHPMGTLSRASTSYTPGDHL